MSEGETIGQIAEKHPFDWSGFNENSAPSIDYSGIPGLGQNLIKKEHSYNPQTNKERFAEYFKKLENEGINSNYDYFDWMGDKNHLIMKNLDAVLESSKPLRSLKNKSERISSNSAKSRSKKLEKATTDQIDALSAYNSVREKQNLTEATQGLVNEYLIASRRLEQFASEVGSLNDVSKRRGELSKEYKSIVEQQRISFGKLMENEEELARVKLVIPGVEDRAKKPTSALTPKQPEQKPEPEVLEPVPAFVEQEPVFPQEDVVQEQEKPPEKPLGIKERLIYGAYYYTQEIKKRYFSEKWRWGLMKEKVIDEATVAIQRKEVGIDATVAKSAIGNLIYEEGVAASGIAVDRSVKRVTNPQDNEVDRGLSEISDSIETAGDKITYVEAGGNEPVVEKYSLDDYKKRLQGIYNTLKDRFPERSDEKISVEVPTGFMGPNNMVDLQTVDALFDEYDHSDDLEDKRGILRTAYVDVLKKQDRVKKDREGLSIFDKLKMVVQPVATAISAMEAEATENINQDKTRAYFEKFKNFWKSVRGIPEEEIDEVNNVAKRVREKEEKDPRFALFIKQLRL